MIASNKINTSNVNNNDKKFNSSVNEDFNNQCMNDDVNVSHIEDIRNSNSS